MTRSRITQQRTAAELRRRRHGNLRATGSVRRETTGRLGLVRATVRRQTRSMEYSKMRFLFVALVLLFGPDLLGAQTRDEAAAREIEQLERAYNQAGLADYYAIGARGTTREVGNQRTEPVNITPSGVMEKSEIRNMRVRVYGDSTVSTYEQRVGGRQNDGTAFELAVVSTHVWVRQDGRWRLALMHSTYL